MHPNEHGTVEVSDRPVTFDAAKELGGFELARQWADRLSWPWPTDWTARDDLAELAYMSALAHWLHQWQPVHIHHALLAGARPEDVAAALGATPSETFDRWHDWSSRQRNSIFASEPAIEDKEYQKVAALFDAVGLTPSSC